MNKVIVLFTAIVLFFSCKTLTKEKNNDTYKIISLHSDVLSEYYYIRGIRGKQEIILLSLKELSDNCETDVVVGNKYDFNLHLLKNVTIDDSTSWRLYNHDFYIGEVFAFPKDMKVYSSDNLVGLCLKQR